MVIGSDIMTEIGIDLFSVNLQLTLYKTRWCPRSFVLEGELSDEKYYEQLYNKHTDSPILQQMEELQGEIFDTNYTKVDIDVIVDGLDIQRSSKRTLKVTLKKYPKLFGG